MSDKKSLANQEESIYKAEISFGQVIISALGQKRALHRVRIHPVLVRVFVGVAFAGMNVKSDKHKLICGMITAALSAQCMSAIAPHLSHNRCNTSNLDRG